MRVGSSTRRLPKRKRAHRNCPLDPTAALSYDCRTLADADPHAPTSELAEPGTAVDQSSSANDVTPAAIKPSRGRMILTAAVLILLCLAMFFAVYATLSRSFDSLAGKAAKSFSGDFDDERELP